MCSKVSVTFDPFMYLSLPLPAKATRTLVVTVVSSMGREAPRRVPLVVNRNANVGEVQRQLAAICQLAPDERLLLTEVGGWVRVPGLIASVIIVSVLTAAMMTASLMIADACHSVGHPVSHLHPSSPSLFPTLLLHSSHPAIPPAPFFHLTLGSDVQLANLPSVRLVCHHGVHRGPRSHRGLPVAPIVRLSDRHSAESQRTVSHGHCNPPLTQIKKQVGKLSRIEVKQEYCLSFTKCMFGATLSLSLVITTPSFCEVPVVLRVWWREGKSTWKLQGPFTQARQFLFLFSDQAWKLSVGADNCVDRFLPLIAPLNLPSAYYSFSCPP